MNHQSVDIVVVGAGFSGLYAVHRFRNLQGLSVQAFDAGAGPGGVWHWNRYPGARCDFESIFYSYSFDEDLQREWRWSERFAAQPEILAYLEHVCDRFDLRRSFRFNTRVTSAVWNEETARWIVRTDDGAVTEARYFINAAGSFSVVKRSDFPGQEDFRGTVLHTRDWPAAGVDLTGKRVAVIGTGSTGIQVIQAIAKGVASLTVFQRTANFACPLGNRPMTDEEFEQVVADYPRLREESRASLAGAAYPRAQRSALWDTPEERRRVYDEYYDGGGFRMLTSTYFDLIYNLEANKTAQDYIRERIRERVNDPETAELLSPNNHPYGVKRATFESGYYETFNLPHVRLVDARSTPIERITSTGLATTAEEFEFDVIVLATGYDVGAAALMQMGVVGRDGLTLDKRWSNGQRAYLGAATYGFPNLFHINGPQGPAALFNNPIAIEDSVDFVSALIAQAEGKAVRAVEVTEAAEERYDQLVREVANATLFPTAPTWYMGDNISEKPRSPLSLFTGAPLFRAITAEAEARGFSGFSFDGEQRPIPSLVRLDGAAAFLLAGMMNMGQKPLEEASLQEARAAMDSFALMQLPVPTGVAITEVEYSGAGGPRTARLYRPPVGDGPLPVIVFIHGGGWIGGSLDAFHEPSATLAARTGALVVSPDYRLAPEHPFPAATDDTFEALQWVADHIQDYGGDPTRLAVGGESAGGNLAAVAALRARNEGGPQLSAQVLITPITDPLADNASRREFAHGPVISVELGRRMSSLYAADPRDLQSPLVAPAKAGNFEGLPPTLVVTMEIDPLRDEGEDYARALQAAGIPTVLRRVDGLFHTAYSFSAPIPKVVEIQGAIADFLVPIFTEAESTVTAR